MSKVVDRRKMRALYKPPPEEDNSRNYLLLVAVILISIVFIAGEVIGGTIAGSVAIISDAIHLVSDLVGFIFSFAFLYLSKMAMSDRMSFGYHRMELLGALANLFIVWVLVFYIIY
jgi:zinc transporter 2